jgi:hypothetical protein
MNFSSRVSGLNTGQAAQLLSLHDICSDNDDRNVANVANNDDHGELFFSITRANAGRGQCLILLTFAKSKRKSSSNKS